MNDYTALFMGYHLIEAPSMVDRRQRRRHKKKRINKKWAKRYGFSETPSTQILIGDGKIIAHPSVIRKIKDNIAIEEQLNRQKDPLSYSSYFMGVW